MRQVHESIGLVGCLLWVVVALIIGFFGNLMLGTVLTVVFGAAIAAKWFAISLWARLLIGFVGSELIFPAWIVAIILSLFLVTPLLH